MASSPFMEVACPCGQRFLVRKGEIGQPAKCPSCWRDFIISAPAPISEAPKAAGPKEAATMKSAAAPSPQPIEGLAMSGGKRRSRLRLWLNRRDPDGILRMTAGTILGFAAAILLLTALRSPLIVGRRNRPPHPVVLSSVPYQVPIGTTATLPGMQTAPTTSPAATGRSPRPSTQATTGTQTRWEGGSLL